MNKQRIGGLAIPSITPFKDEDAAAIDFARLDRLVDYLIDVQKADILIPVGTTGESTSLSHEEKAMVIERVVRKVGNRALVFAGTGGPNTDETISLTRHAQECGAHGVLVVAPYYILSV